MNAPVHALTFDVEDWHQLVEWKLTGTMPACSPHVLIQTHDILDALSRRGIRATFFILALVARAFPQLVRDIHGAGHEVGSHGWSHRLVYRQTPDEFARETRDAKSLLEDIVGTSIAGYRAAEFSITEASRWALHILAEIGFRYDSSIFPVRSGRYGIPDTPLGVHYIHTPGGDILELPLTVVDWHSHRYAVGGGGYFRLFPYAITRAAIAKLSAAGRSAVLYFHPYEFSAEPLWPRLPKITQYLSGGRYLLLHNVNRRLNRARFERLLNEWPLVTAAEVVQRGH